MTVSMKRANLQVPEDEYERFSNKVQKFYKKDSMRSYAFRILMHGWIEGLINIQEIEKGLEELPHDVYVGGYHSVEGRNRNEFGEFE